MFVLHPTHLLLCYCDNLIPKHLKSAFIYKIKGCIDKDQCAFAVRSWNRSQSLYLSRYVYLLRNSIMPHTKLSFRLAPARENSIPSPIENRILSNIDSPFKFSEHREVDKRVSSWRDLLQSGIHDQRAHVSGGQTEDIPASVREVEAEGSVEMGERHDARETGQRNDPEVDAAA